MYWTDWEEDPKDSKRGKIERAWMDGSNRNIFITSKTVLWPNGLSLDIPAKILYWVDAFYDRIEMVYLNGTERKASGGPAGSWSLISSGQGMRAVLLRLAVFAAGLLSRRLAAFSRVRLLSVPSSALSLPCPFCPTLRGCPEHPTS